MEWLVNGKSITLFSLLFGLGFALQLERAEARGADGLPRYVRRLLVLAGMGLVHGYFIWWGDILLTYAVVGLLMVPVRRLSDRVLLTSGLVITLLPPLLSPWIRAWLPEMSKQPEVYAGALRAFSSVSWPDTLHENIRVANWARVSNWPLVFFVLGRFLLGYWAGRLGLLQHPERHQVLLRRVFGWSLAIGIAVTWLSFVQAALRESHPLLDREAGKLVIRVLLRVGPLALGITYATGFALLFPRPAWKRRLRVLAPVGRMALTHYLTQSVLGVAFFYGIGVGIGPRWGVAGWWGAWAVIFVAQLLISHFWLARFRYGPMEWLWRWLTYGRRPELRRHAATALSGVD